MVTRGEIIENRERLEDMMQFLSLLHNLHVLALHTWKIKAIDYYISDAKRDALITRYQTLKAQLATKYEGLL